MLSKQEIRAFDLIIKRIDCGFVNKTNKRLATYSGRFATVISHMNVKQGKYSINDFYDWHPLMPIINGKLYSRNIGNITNIHRLSIYDVCVPFCEGYYKDPNFRDYWSKGSRESCAFNLGRAFLKRYNGYCLPFHLVPEIDVIFNSLPVL